MKFKYLPLAIASLTLNGFSVPSMAAGKTHRSPASFENQPRLSEDCEAFLYAKVDKQLPKDQFVTRMRLHAPNSEMVDLEITRDTGNQNYCIKNSTAKIHDEHNGVCDILNVTISTDNFDCG